VGRRSVPTKIGLVPALIGDQSSKRRRRHSRTLCDASRQTRRHERPSWATRSEPRADAGPTAACAALSCPSGSPSPRQTRSRRDCSGDARPAAASEPESRRRQLRAFRPSPPAFFGQRRRESLVTAGPCNGVEESALAIAPRLL